MKPIDVIAVKNAVTNGQLAAELNPNGSILLKDLRSGEAVIIGTTCHIPAKHKKKRGKWEYWDGWSGNHDQRIDDATCSLCGYKHHTVRPDPNKSLHTPLNLSSHCPGCGAEMEKE